MHTLPLHKKLAYGCGMMGWSMLINLISVILVYMYLPPSGSGLPPLISQAAIFGIFNLIALITAAGRFADAIYDPFIARLSDRSTNKKGRRIPFMKLAILPSMLFCFLIFYPLSVSESPANAGWLLFTLVAFYVSSTTYIIPYNALLPEFARSAADRVTLSSYQAVGYVGGIALASNTFNICQLLQHSFEMQSRLQALQLTIAMLVIVAGIFLAIPVMFINEKEFSASRPSHTRMRTAILQTFRNRNFLLFLVADFAYFVGITIITSGLLYFVTVLLLLPESIGNKLMILLVLCSLLCYPLVNGLYRKAGPRRMMTAAFILLALVFAGIFFLGKPNIAPGLQIYPLIIFAALPMAILSILPNAILAEIIEWENKRTGENNEATFFAVRYFFVKIAQTIGIAAFAMLLLQGKDTGNDLGLRLNGLLGFGLCVMAAVAFSFYREKKV